MKSYDLGFNSLHDAEPGLSDKAAASVCLGGLYLGLATAAAIGSAYDYAKEAFSAPAEITVGGGVLAEHDNPFAE